MSERFLRLHPDGTDSEFFESSPRLKTPHADRHQGMNSRHRAGAGSVHSCCDQCPGSAPDGEPRLERIPGYRDRSPDGQRTIVVQDFVFTHDNRKRKYDCDCFDVGI